MNEWISDVLMTLSGMAIITLIILIITFAMSWIMTPPEHKPNDAAPGTDRTPGLKTGPGGDFVDTYM